MTKTKLLAFKSKALKFGVDLCHCWGSFYCDTIQLVRCVLESSLNMIQPKVLRQVCLCGSAIFFTMFLHLSDLIDFFVVIKLYSLHNLTPVILTYTPFL